VTAILGYARVSTTSQELDAQLDVLFAADAETGRIFPDKLSARP
jgi:DNA invertase Pin-like site-specific DNA recombinase